MGTSYGCLNCNKLLHPWLPLCSGKPSKKQSSHLSTTDVCGRTDQLCEGTVFIFPFRNCGPCTYAQGEDCLPQSPYDEVLISTLNSSLFGDKVFVDVIKLSWSQGSYNPKLVSEVSMQRGEIMWRATGRWPLALSTSLGETHRALPSLTASKEACEPVPDLRLQTSKLG